MDLVIESLISSWIVCGVATGCWSIAVATASVAVFVLILWYQANAAFAASSSHSIDLRLELKLCVSFGRIFVSSSVTFVVSSAAGGYW